jgi:hypothetical protein
MKRIDKLQFKIVRYYNLSDVEVPVEVYKSMKYINDTHVVPSYYRRPPVDDYFTLKGNIDKDDIQNVALDWIKDDVGKELSHYEEYTIIEIETGE